MGKKEAVEKNKADKKNSAEQSYGEKTLPPGDILGPSNSDASSRSAVPERKWSSSSIQPLMVLEYCNEPTRRVSVQPDLPPIIQILPERPETIINTGGNLEAWNKQVQENIKFITYKKFSTPRKAKLWLYRNLVGVGLSFLLVFSAFLGLQNLQSSINAEGGLGLATLSIVYVFFTLAGFVTPGIIKLLGTKYSLVGGFLCHLIYTMANFYPSWYTLVPASVLLGFASAPIWAAGNAHLVMISVTAAPALGVDQNHLIGSMVAIFFSFFQGAQIPGNLASSLIFFPYSGSESNSSLDMDLSNVSATCDATENARIGSIYIYILSSVYFVMVSLGIGTLLLLVNHLPSEKKPGKTIGQKLKLYFGDPFNALLKLLKDIKMILVLPMAFVGGLEQSFLFGIFTQVVIANCFGAYLVGFSIIIFGVSSAVAGLVFSQVVKHVPWYFLFVIGGTINISLVIFLILWSLSPSYAVVFVFVFLWGTGDAVWNTMTSYVVGVLFPEKSELAYSVHRIMLAIGLGSGFLIAEFSSLYGCCYVILGAVVIAVLSSVILEVKTRSKEIILPCFFSKSSEYDTTKEKVEH